MSGMLFKVSIHPLYDDAKLTIYYDGERVGLVTDEPDDTDSTLNCSLTIAECRALARGLDAVADLAEADDYVPIQEREA